MWKVCISLIFFMVILHRLANASSESENLSYRLPNNTKPIRYDLELITHIHKYGSEDQFNFEGKVKIEVDVKEDKTDSITLNYRQITIHHVLLEFGDESLIDSNSSYSLDPVREFLIIMPQKLLVKGVYNLTIDYSGILRKDNAGFYRSSYVDENGTIQWLATTQFSSTDARHAFPCYDEPGIRAPIGLTLIYGKNMTWAISNTVASAHYTMENELEGYYKVEFPDTPVMQTYLLAIVVCNFSKFHYLAENRQFLYTRDSGEENALFGLEAGAKIMDYLENYLEIEYPLEKIDQVAIPDFAAGAMENWGLVTYKEENLIYNPKTSALSQKKKIATTIGHEYGHQYFGNLVSPAWWSYLWLKEGFARLFEYQASNAAFPEMQISQTFGIEKIQNAFILDSLDATRPMSYYVESQIAIANLFDDIAYDKSGSVLRMLQHAFSEGAFRVGMKNYLMDRKFQFGTPEILAHNIQKAVNEIKPLSNGITVRDVIKSWSETKGFPVVHVSLTKSGEIYIEQEKYLLKYKETSPKTKWYIPYTIVTATTPDFDDTTPNGWLTASAALLNPSSTLNWTTNDWIILNKQQTGFYRVNYHNELWQRIISKLFDKHDDIHAMNRAQLIDDCLNLARSDRLPYEIPLELINYLQFEDHYVPWGAASRNLDFLALMMSDSAKVSKFHAFLLKIVFPLYEKRGIEAKPDEKLFDKLSRDIAIDWTCKLGNSDCLAKTEEKLISVLNNKTLKIEPDVKATVYCNGLRKAKDSIYKQVWEEMLNGQDQADRLRLIRSLACTEDESNLKKYLDSTIDKGYNYRGQERYRVLTEVYSFSRTGMDVSIEFLDQNMEEINNMYNEGVFGGRAIGRVVDGMGKRIATSVQYENFDKLVTELKINNYINDLEEAKAREHSSENMEWVKRKRGEIDEFFNNGPTVFLSFYLLIFSVVIKSIL